MNLPEYRNTLERLAREKTGEPIPNATLEHAAILMETMFANAKSVVCILTGSFNKSLYGKHEVVTQAQHFLADRNHKLSILFERQIDVDDLRNHPLLSSLRADANVEIYQIPEHIAEGVAVHFAIMDDDSYRFEGDKHEHAAIAAFGDKDFSDVAIQAFDSLIQGSTKLPWPLPSSG